MTHILPEPNIEDMLRHIALLFDWTVDAYPNARFEVRCIHPHNKPVRSRQFQCTDAKYVEAATWAIDVNQEGFNVYVTVNPLKPDTARAAGDTDVEIARYHFTDHDGIDDPDDLLDRCSHAFTPAFRVITGSIPLPRLHPYWMMSDPVRSMEAWRKTQQDLAAGFGSDPSVVNPARILRLAGTVSYPDDRKSAKGYIPELVRLDLGECRQVDPIAFASQFHRPPKPARNEAEYPSTPEGPGNVPLYVIDAALMAIPPISINGSRKLWLEIAYAVKDANSAARQAFEVWQRQSALYDEKDAHLWDTISPSPSSYTGLFRHARNADRDWWKHDPSVAVWWRARAAQWEVSTSPCEHRNATEIIANLAGRHAAGEQVDVDLCVADLGGDQADIRKVRDYATRVLRVPATEFKKAVQRKRTAEALGVVPETAPEFVRTFVEREGVTCRFNGILSKDGDPTCDLGYNELQRNMRVFADEFQMAKLGIGHLQINDAADKWYIEAQRARKQLILSTIEWCGDEAVRLSMGSALVVMVDKCFECPEGPEFVAAVFRKFIHQVKRKMKRMVVYNHLMPVIISPQQGIGKTTFVERLIGPAEEVSIPVDFKQITDDRNIAMWRNYVMYLEEMGWASKADIDSVKHIITAPTLTRRPMRMNHTEEVRQNATLIGTANVMSVSDLIRDPTGMRRFVGIVMRDDADWNSINEMDWLRLWRSVDQTAADPIQPFKHLLVERQEADREKAPVEVWQEQIDPDAFLGGAVKRRRAFSRDELFADFHPWEEDHFPRCDTTVARFARELGRIARQFPDATKFVPDRDGSGRGWKWVGEATNVRRIYG